MYKIDIKMAKNYTLTKKIAKHGNQSVIIIPSFLKTELCPKTIVELNIKIVKEAEQDGERNK